MFSPFDDFMFSAIPIFGSIIFVIVIVGFIVTIFKSIKQWNYNNSQPVLSVEAKVVGKRADVSRHHHNNDGHMHSHTSTTYYVTFEVESKDRMEFKVSSKEYGLLAENDMGKLTFQGTRYLEFERVK